MKIEIRNGRLVDPTNGQDEPASLFVAAGKIVGHGRTPPGFVPNRTIDARGLIVCPGFVDLSARVGGATSELEAAAAAGVTTVCCPPDTNPPLDEPGLVERLVSRAQTLRLARVLPVGALTAGLQGEALAEMNALAAAGCVAFSQADRPIGNTQVLYRALQYASTFDLPVWLRAEDPFLAAGGVAHDGEVAARLGLPGIPSCAESIALHTLLVLARETGARVHVTRLSTAAGVEMIRLARSSGVRVTADAAIHHLHLCESDIGYFDSRSRVSPPLRSAEDRAALCRGAVDGTLQALCSDHAPVPGDRKQMPFAEAEAGATGIELLLPLTLRWAAAHGVEMADALRRISTDPARIAGLDPQGLAEGSPADLCLFDPDETWIVSPDSLRSKGHNTPFLGREMRGRVRATLLAGHSVFSA